VFFCKAQNLVPNPSFETYTLCPNTDGQILSAAPWTAATATCSSDYFNTCSANYGSNNPFAFQLPRTGNAYAGLYFYIGNLREYLQVQLTIPLVQNKTYYVEFFVSFYKIAAFTTPCNNIAANLSSAQPYTANLGELQPLTPHILNIGNPIISDTLNWVKVSGCYLAQGGEEYLTIGNFFDNLNTVTTNSNNIAYYFVDDVSVFEITGTCVNGINELSTNFNIDMYPNPTNGILNLKLLDAGKDVEIIITDVLGREVLISDYKVQINISDLETGIYFLSVYKEDKFVGTKKIIKE
jgi:hypothetical protein